MGTEARPGVNGAETYQAIKDIQRDWRLAGKDVGILRRLGQSVELPHAVSSRVYDLTLDNLPWYVTQKEPDIADRLRNSHPIPIIAFSLVADERSFDQTIGVANRLDYPADLEDPVSKEAWKNGVNLLTEVATEITDIHIRTSLHHSRQRSRFLGRDLNLVGYGGSLRELQDLIGEEDLYSFQDALIMSHLTGDNSHIESQMQRFGWQSFNEGARAIGSRATPLEELDKSRLKLSKEAAGFVRSNQPGVLNILVNEAVLHGSLGAEAVLAGVYGLVRKTPQALDALYFGLRQLKTAHLYLSGFPKVLIHEMIHYFTQDKARLGFMPLKAK